MNDLILIAAMDRNRVIGVNNTLPWHIPADLKFFKKTTLGHNVVMGRKTYESIGKPLPFRTNVVLSRDPNYYLDYCIVCNSVEEVLRLHSISPKNTYVIGGADLFNLFMPYANKIYVTIIDESFRGDTYFPEIDLKQWVEKSKNHVAKNEETPYDLKFMEYDKL